MEKFQQTTIDADLFQVEDVQNDNACCYRAIANGLNYLSGKKSSADILRDSIFSRTKKLDHIFRDPDWGFEGDEQENLARELQSLAYQWVKDHPKESINMTGNGEDEDLSMSVEDLVCLTHDLSFAEYLNNYQYFAGDIIIHSDSDGEGDNRANPDNPSELASPNIMEERWGGYIEQVAISQYFQIPIVILVPQRYDQRRNKIYTGVIYRNKPYKGVRYKISQIVGKEFLRGENHPLYLVWKKTETGPHYMAIYPYHSKKCKQLVQKMN